MVEETVAITKIKTVAVRPVFGGLNPGDIEDLFNTPLKPGHAAAFSTDCDLPSTHEMVRSIGMQVHFLSSLGFFLFNKSSQTPWN